MSEKISLDSSVLILIKLRVKVVNFYKICNLFYYI